MRLSHIFAAALCLSGIAAHADTFSYTIDGGSSGFSGSGTLYGNPIGNGVELINNITGTGVDNIIAPGGFNNNDNLFYSTSSPLFDGQGLSFVDQNSTGVYDVDLYGTIDAKGVAKYHAYIKDNDGDIVIVPVKFTANPTVTPEPSSILLLGTGLLGVAGLVIKKTI